jgi:hypothetical protein
MSKMGSHDPFGYLKHKLWPKEGLGIKLSIWLLTTKSQESPWFTCVQVACHIPLESFQQRLQLCFRPDLNWRSAQEVMGLQSHKNPNFGTPNLGNLGQNDIWLQAPWPGTKNTIRGKVIDSLKSGPWWVLWVCVYPWFVRAPKVFQLCIN